MKIKIKNIKSFSTTNVDGKQHVTITGDDDMEIEKIYEPEPEE